MVQDGQKLGGLDSVDQWPWSWVRLLSFVRKIKNVYERAAMDSEPESAIPAKWMFFGHEKELGAWFDERREAQKDKKRERASED